MNACPLVSACSFRNAYSKLDDARRTLTVADSLRVQAGVAYDDSLALAETVTAFDTWWHRTFYPAYYAKANYYYGRLLRNRGDQPAAMLAFLRAAHTDPGFPVRAARIGLPFRSVSAEEYAILGRVYSNIGSMCHLAENYDTSKKMLQLSAELFLLACDSVNYLYACYESAYESAELGMKEEAVRELRHIDSCCNDSSIIGLVYLAYAQAYFRAKQYDSALYYANLEQRFYPREHVGLLIKAQVFSHFAAKDSAVFYAKQIIADGKDWENKHKAYYILQHEDDGITKDSVNILAGNRTDVHNALDVRHQALAQAVQLLNQDIGGSKESDAYLRKALVWSALVFFTILLLLSALWVYIHKKVSTEKTQMQKYIARNTTELQAVVQEKEHMEEDVQVLQHKHELLKQQIRTTIENNCTYILRDEKNLKMASQAKKHTRFLTLMDKYFYGIATYLEKDYRLREQELMFCSLVLLNLSGPQIAKTLCYGENSIGTIKKRIIRKLELPDRANLRNELINIVLSKNLA